MPTQKILIGYDRSPDAQAAAAWALDEAERTGAPVEFFYAYEWPRWIPAASMVPAPAVWPDSEAEHAIKSALTDAVTAAAAAHPAVRTDLVIAYAGAAPTLIERSAQASLVVLGSRGHSGVANLLGSVSAAVSAHANCPVVVVRGDLVADAQVVAGIDDSPAAESVMAFAVERAASRHVPLHVIHAWEPAVETAEGIPPITRTVTDDERRFFENMVGEWQQKRPDVTITAEAVVEHPAAALVRTSTSAGLLVVGSRGRGAFRGMLLGSVSQHLLRHSACTLAIVHNRAS